MNHEPSHDPTRNPTEETLLLAHDADGIREFDNPMPAWWTWSFWATIAYSCLYAMYYMFGAGPNVATDYDADVSAHWQVQAERLGELKAEPAVIARLIADPRMMQAASGLFGANCAVCHAKDGGGLTGPNLCDDEWINVKTVADLFPVISAGVPQRGMPAWDKRFSESQRVLLAAYVAHLRGSTPAAPKAPQGNTIAAWTLPAAEQTAKD